MDDSWLIREVDRSESGSVCEYPPCTVTCMSHQRYRKADYKQVHNRRVDGRVHAVCPSSAKYLERNDPDRVSQIRTFYLNILEFSDRVQDFFLIICPMVDFPARVPPDLAKSHLLYSMNMSLGDGFGDQY